MPLLNWVNDITARSAASEVPFHLLKKVSSFGDGSAAKENLLIQGDNLLALKALLPFYRGKVKCIYIDPPYNTGSAFEHYDDNLEHSQWLSMMYSRLALLREFLSPDGTIWISIDDEEEAYLKVLCDEIFGRKNFISNISVNMKNIAGASGGGEDKKLKKTCEFLLVYSKDFNSFQPFEPVYSFKPIYSLAEQYELEGKSWKYTNVLVNEGEKEYIGSTKDGSGDEIKIFKRINFEIKTIKELAESEEISIERAYSKYALKIFQTTNAQSSIRQRVIDFIEENNLENDLLSIEYIPKSGKFKNRLYEQFYRGNKCRLFAWLKDTAEEINGTLYKKDKLGSYWDMNYWMKNVSKEGGVVFNQSKKPEALVNIILQMATKPNEYVLDSFLGSATTAAVAQKMRRRFIGMEIGSHAITHCIPRLQKVIEGEQGGISKAVEWSGGSGFTFYELGPTVFDQYGSINPSVDFETLAAYVWQKETNTVTVPSRSPYLGTSGNISIFLLYNGVLGDRRPEAGNVLTTKILRMLEKEFPLDGQKIIYGEAVIGLTDSELNKKGITFKQIPYDVTE